MGRHYDTQPNVTRDLDAAALRRLDLPMEGQLVMELGAGTGKNTQYLAAHAREVLALDFSPAMLRRATTDQEPSVRKERQ